MSQQAATSKGTPVTGEADAKLRLLGQLVAALARRQPAAAAVAMRLLGQLAVVVLHARTLPDEQGAATLALVSDALGACTEALHRGDHARLEQAVGAFARVARG